MIKALKLPQNQTGRLILKMEGGKSNQNRILLSLIKRLKMIILTRKRKRRQVKRD